MKALKHYAMTRKFTIRRVHSAPRMDSLTLVEELLFQVHYSSQAWRRNWKELLYASKDKFSSVLPQKRHPAFRFSNLLSWPLVPPWGSAQLAHSRGNALGASAVVKTTGRLERTINVYDNTWNRSSLAGDHDIIVFSWQHLSNSAAW